MLSFVAISRAALRGHASARWAAASRVARMAMPLISRAAAAHLPHRSLNSAAAPPPVPCLVQHPAPEFSAKAVVNGAFENINLADYRGQWVVLFFYPMDWTFVCPTEITAFSDELAKFKSLNAQPIAVSVDSVYSHLAWINTPRSKGGLGEMAIPMVADVHKTIARDYGVLIPSSGVALRGLFLIDPSGVVRQSTINDLPVGRNVQEVLRLIEAFQYYEKHGEVCPANWVKGGKTIKPDPIESQEYFGG